MKMHDLSKTEKIKLKWFFRFLKENMALYKFFNHLIKMGRINSHIGFFKSRKMLFYTYEAHINSHTNEDITFFTNLHGLWLIYMYEYKLYGLTYTCSLSDLLDEIYETKTFYTLKKPIFDKLTLILKIEDGKKIKS